MKITEIKTFVANAYRTNFVFVKLYTDEGITGVGEGTLEYKEHALLGAVEDLKGYLLGTDPRRIEEHVFHMYRDSYWRTGPVLMSAISAVEMAMWDITGKYYGAPVHALLGGPVREEIELYANGWFAGARKPEEFAAKARAAVEKGVRALKWDPFGSAYLTLERREFAESIDCVAAVRDAVGGDVELLIEGHGRLNVETATRMARALAPYGPMFFEEPVPPDNLDALAEVGVTPRAEEAPKGGVFEGESVVLTGSLAHYKRSEAQKIVESLGGVCQSAVTAKTTLVLAGEDAGSKLEKAQKLGVRIIDEAEFERLIGKN